MASRRASASARGRWVPWPKWRRRRWRRTKWCPPCCWGDLTLLWMMLLQDNIYILYIYIFYVIMYIYIIYMCVYMNLYFFICISICHIGFVWHISSCRYLHDICIIYIYIYMCVYRVSSIYIYIHVYVYVWPGDYWMVEQELVEYKVYLIYLYIAYSRSLPVVPHKAVAEVSKIGNL